MSGVAKRLYCGFNYIWILRSSRGGRGASAGWGFRNDAATAASGLLGSDIWRVADLVTRMLAD